MKKINSNYKIKNATKFKHAKGSKSVKVIKKYSLGAKNISYAGDKPYDIDQAGIDATAQANYTANKTPDIGGMAGGMIGGAGALAIEGLTKSKYDGRYTSQLKDENQATGRAMGAGIGQAANLILPGLGTIASPILSSAGGAIQRGLQNSKLEDIKKTADYKDRIAKNNENVQTDLTAFQAKQYSKGSKKISKYGGGVPKIKVATKQDSLDLYNNANEVQNYYKNQKYQAGTPLGTEHQNVFEDLDWTHKAVQDNVGAGHKSKIANEDGSIEERVLKPEEYRQDIDENKFYQREKQHGIIDKRAPKQLFDKRVKPQTSNNYKNIGFNDKLKGDEVSTYQYDPIAVKPWQDMSMIEKAKRVEQYGVPNGVKYDPTAKDKPIEQLASKSVKMDSTSTKPVVKPIVKPIPLPTVSKPTVTTPVDTTNTAVKTKPTGPDYGVHGQKTIVIPSSDPSNKTGRAIYKVVGVNYDPNASRLRVSKDELPKQKSKMQNGGTLNKPKTKVIEIEGKGTPEIHTDKDFNIKNLGTTPHNKGGNKVVATEGDIVFPTQNSKEKYSEIMTAIMKKDKYKLKKEQNKLPEDKATKYVKGVKGTKGGEDNYMDFSPWSSALNTVGSGASELIKRSTIPGYNGTTSAKAPAKVTKTTVAKGENKGAAKQSTTNRAVGSSAPSNLTASSQIQPINDANGKPMYYDDVNRNQQYDAKRDWNAPGAKDLSAHDPSNPYAKNGLPVRAVPTADGKTRYYQNPTGIEPMETRMTMGSSNAPVLPAKLNPIDIQKEKDKNVEQPTGGNGFKSKYNPLELASTAYNLGTGLFGNAEKVNRKEYNPELERYVDTSNNVRREINQGFKTNVGNARNLSAGSANNFRSNAQAAGNNKINQVNSVDSQEYGKQLDVNNRNVDRINDGKKVNIDLFNGYEDQDAKNRAVKSDALSRGFEGLSDIGTRANLNNNALQAWTQNANVLGSGRSYGAQYDVNGNQVGNLNAGFTNGTGIPVQPANPTSKTKVDKKEKGMKSLTITRKYKLK